VSGCFRTNVPDYCIVASGDEGMDLLDATIQAVQGLLKRGTIEPLAVEHAIQVEVMVVGAS